MADNSAQNGTDTIRDIDRGAGVKTQVSQIDVGGGSGNAESLLVRGQQVSANSLPMVLASDQSPVGAKITDGTNTASVVPASTVPNSAYPALVVALSPLSSSLQTTPGLSKNGYAAGSISAQNTAPTSTTPTANSTFGPLNGVITPAGANSLFIYIDPSSIWSCAAGLVLQTGSFTSFVNVGGAVFRNLTTGAITSAIPSGATGAFFADISGLSTVNLRLSSGNSAWTGSAGLTFTSSTASQNTLAAAITDGFNVAALKGASTAAVATDTSLVVALSPNSPVAQAALTKGTQGVTGVSTQDLKDAGRNMTVYYMLIPVLATATDTLQNLTGTKAGATVAATTTPAVVTTGKTFRVTRFSATYIATATSGYGIARLRFNTTGAVLITSPIAAQLVVGAGTPATANSAGSEDACVPDGLEFPAGTGIGISVQGFAAATGAAVGYVVAKLSGFEY